MLYSKDINKQNYYVSKYNYIQESKDGGWLIYNSLSRKIRKIPYQSVQTAEKLLGSRKEIEIDKSSKEYQLVEDGFLQKYAFDETFAAHAKYMTEISEPVLGLTIVPTYRCNCRCPYCYQDHENGTIMTKEIQDSIISFVKKNISHYTGVEISWFGGEPLLCSDTIIYINNEIKKICTLRYKTFKSAITTNGYLLTKELFENLVSSGIRRYFITIDGQKDIHDKQRYLANKAGTFDTIIANLEEIKGISKTKRFIINIRTNVSKILSSQLEEYIADMSRRFGNDSRFGFFFRPVFDWGGESIEGFRENLLDEDQGIIDIFDKLLESKYCLNYAEHYFDLTQPSMCYASKINDFVINPDGTINKCTCSDTQGNNLIGRLLNTGKMELDFGKIGMWCSQYKEDAECNNCYLQGQCLKSYCVSEQVMKNKNYKKCFITKSVCGKMLLLLDKCNETYYYINEISL